MADASICPGHRSASCPPLAWLSDKLSAHPQADDKIHSLTLHHLYGRLHKALKDIAIHQQHLRHAHTTLLAHDPEVTPDMIAHQLLTWKRWSSGLVEAAGILDGQVHFFLHQTESCSVARQPDAVMAPPALAVEPSEDADQVTLSGLHGRMK